MGTWGTSIFSDDTACDVRDEFREHIGDGLSADEATRRVIESHNMNAKGRKDNPEDATFWLGLAATQWECGRLLDTVKSRALRVIASGADLSLFDEYAKPKDIAKRRAALEKLRLQLLSPQPAPKKIKKTFREQTDWEVGHAVSYLLLSGRLIVFRIIHIENRNNSRYPIADLCDWVGQSAPDSATIVSLLRRHTKYLQSQLQDREPMTPSSFRPGTPPEVIKLLSESFSDPEYRERCNRRTIETNGKMALCRSNPRDFPEDRVKVLATGLPVKPDEHGIIGASHFGGWKELDMHLSDYFDIE